MKHTCKQSRILENRPPVGRLIEAGPPPLLENRRKSYADKRPPANPRLMSNAQFIEYVKGVMAEEGISSRLEMKKSRPRVFESLMRRSNKTPDVMEGTGLTMEASQFEVMTVREITDAAKSLIDAKGITSVPDLRDAAPDLYRSLCRIGRIECAIRHMRSKVTKTRSLIPPALLSKT